MHQHLLPSAYIRKHFYISGNTLPNYGVLILTKFPSHFFEVPLFGTKMSRSLLVCEPLTILNSEHTSPFAVCTLHLESGAGLSQQATRQEQLRMCLQKLKESYGERGFMLMGDFNFDENTAPET
jgi:endonuclease/exonuclease/phosphatase family metal-dependent hydrolase